MRDSYEEGRKKMMGNEYVCGERVEKRRWQKEKDKK